MYSIADFTPLASCTALKDLNLAYNQMANIDGLAHIHALENLNLSDCSFLTSIMPLTGLRHLADLDISDCSQVPAADVCFVLDQPNAFTHLCCCGSAFAAQELCSSKWGSLARSRESEFWAL